MNHKLTFLVLLLLSMLFSACNDGLLSFDRTFPKQGKNLADILGSSFSYITENGTDTTTIKIDFKPDTKLNHLTDANTGAILSSCWVSKFRQLYYFSEQKNDTSFWIYAVHIDDTEIRGLATGWEQMTHLQNKVDEGEFADLVKYRNPSTDKAIQLTYKKAKLKKFYQSIVDTLPALKIIPNLEHNTSKDIATSDTTKQSATTKIDLEAKTELHSNLVKKLYPNPATEQFTIEFSKTGNFRIALFDINGKRIQSIEENSDKVTIPLTDVLSGTYYVRTTELTTGKGTTTQLIVK